MKYRCEEADLIRHRRLALASEIAFLRLGHCQQQAVDGFVDHLTEEKVSHQGDRNDREQHQRPHQSTKLCSRAVALVESQQDVHRPKVGWSAGLEYVNTRCSCYQ